MRKLLAILAIISTIFGFTYSQDASAIPGGSFCQGGDLWVVSYVWNAQYSGWVQMIDVYPGHFQCIVA